MTAQREARPRDPSSARTPWAGLWLSRALLERYAGLAFAVFAVAHLSIYAWRAGRGSFFDAGRRWESHPGFLLAMLGLVWAPFGVVALRGLTRRARSDDGSPRVVPRAVEGLSLAIVLCFAVAHGGWFALGLLSGRLTGEDSLVELVAGLSSLSAGLPLRAAAYLLAVAAMAFCAARGVWPGSPSKRTLVAARVLFGTALYVVGACTVIRIATGSLAPW